MAAVPAQGRCKYARMGELVTRGPPRRVSAYEISKSTEFRISDWFSRFQYGFLDFVWKSIICYSENTATIYY